MHLFIAGTIGFVAGVVLTMLFAAPVRSRVTAVEKTVVDEVAHLRADIVAEIRKGASHLLLIFGVIGLLGFGHVLRAQTMTARQASVAQIGQAPASPVLRMSSFEALRISSFAGPRIRRATLRRVPVRMRPEGSLAVWVPWRVSGNMRNAASGYQTPPQRPQIRLDAGKTLYRAI